MNAPIQNLPAPITPKPPSEIGREAWSVRIRSLGARRDDREFLPAHIEVLETPAAPLAIASLWVICALFAAALAWSFFAKLDIHAVAAGRVQPSGRSKILQPFESGRIRSLLVQNGQTVKQGELLLELDPTEAMAERDAFARELESVSAEISRRVAVLAALNADELTAEPSFPPDTSELVKMREAASAKASLGQYHSTRASFEAQRREREAQKQRFTSSTAARERLVAVLKERVDMRETLVSREAGTRASVIDARQMMEEQVTNVALEKGQLEEAEAAGFSLGKRMEQLKNDVIAQETQKLSEAYQKQDRLRQDVVKARAKEMRTRLTSPIDGFVQQLAVTTVGQVVSSGQALLVIVPSDARMEIEALVLNRDVGFVQPGQEAVIKLETFPFTRYGTLEGRVVRISNDAVEDREAAASGDPASVARGQSGSSTIGTTRTQNLVYPVTIELVSPSILVDGKTIPLSPGMMATVEIHTGKRRVIDYLLAPLREMASTAARER